ncbi:MAG: hypothetical protein ACRDOY_00030 [Nocardioidaceae bacterium]
MTITPQAEQSGVAPARVVYLHLGAPKTGTTHLQAMLHAHRDRLRAAGCFYPPSRLSAHHDEARDLRSARPGGFLHPKVPGSWDRLVGRLQQWDGHGVAVVSSELLGFANAAQARRAVESLQPAEVHLVITLRDLVRQVPAVWQETVKNRSPMQYDEFLRRLAERGDGPGPRRIWDAQDPARILERWGADIPDERIHLVTVPPAGTDKGLLWRRFCQVLGVEPDDYPLVPAGANTSLGLAETEVVRRLNEQLQSCPWPFYSSHIKNGIAQGVLAGGTTGARIVLPQSMQPWVEGRTKQIIDAISERGYDVVGDLDDLRATPDAAGERDPAAPDPAELAAASATAANYLAREFARTWRRSRRKSKEPPPPQRQGLKQTLVGMSERHRAVDVLRRGYRVARRRVGR